MEPDLKDLMTAVRATFRAASRGYPDEYDAALAAVEREAAAFYVRRLEYITAHGDDTRVGTRIRAQEELDRWRKVLEAG